MTIKPNDQTKIQEITTEIEREREREMMMTDCLVRAFDKKTTVNQPSTTCRALSVVGGFWMKPKKGTAWADNNRKTDDKKDDRIVSNELSSRKKTKQHTRLTATHQDSTRTDDKVRRASGTIDKFEDSNGRAKHRKRFVHCE
jgi:hypothetical protein